jgi:hypothetical protein
VWPVEHPAICRHRGGWSAASTDCRAVRVATRRAVREGWCEPHSRCRPLVGLSATRLPALFAMREDSSLSHVLGQLATRPPQFRFPDGRCYPSPRFSSGTVWGRLVGPASGGFRRFRADFRRAKWSPGLGSALVETVFSSPSRRFESRLGSSVGPPAPTSSKPGSPTGLGDGSAGSAGRVSRKRSASQATVLPERLGGGEGELCFWSARQRRAGHAPPQRSRTERGSRLRLRRGLRCAGTLRAGH